MPDGNGQRPRLAIDFTDLARSQLRAVARRAIYAQQGKPVAEAVRQLLARLAHDPKEFGEPLYHLRAMRMEVRGAVRGPVYFEYGVHDTQPIVIVRNVSGLPDWA